MMSSNDEDAQFLTYKDDPRIPCQYGIKCYQKNPLHHNRYKHPPKKTTPKQKRIKITKRKRSVPEDDTIQSEGSQEKLQKIHDTLEKSSLSSSSDNDMKDCDGNDKEKSDNDLTQTLSTDYRHSPNSTENIILSDTDAEKIIMDLFLVKMPKDFFQFYEFCKNLSSNEPLSAFRSVRLKLVGPYDVLNGRIKNVSNEDDREKYLKHWRYYYDPPEFQCIIKCDDKEGLHFGYWRDDVTEKPVFIAKNRANVDCVFKPVAANIFGALDSYLQNKVKSANPFEKISIKRLHSQLKSFAKQHGITLEKDTTDMRSREKKVVARTFHRIGIVVPYDKKTQLGYRELIVTDSELQKILKQLKEAATLDERKTMIMKLDEIIRLATIAADECDFGTCLELGHDLFSDGGIHVQSRAVQMLSIAYTHLQRPQLLRILNAHLKDRKKDCELSVI